MSEFEWFNFALCCCRGASLCFGDLHPDNVLHEEHSLKAVKKAYYSDLEKYHNEYVVLVYFVNPFDTLNCYFQLCFCFELFCHHAVVLLFGQYD